MRSNNPEAGEGDWAVCASVGLAIPSSFLRAQRHRKAAIGSFPEHDHLGAAWNSHVARQLLGCRCALELPGADAGSFANSVPL